MTASPRPEVVVAVVPAWNEAERIGETVRSLLAVPEVDEVVVLDDGSADRTAALASSAGARVLSAATNLGKGGALEGAVDALPSAAVYLLADGDLGASASGLGSLLEPVRSGAADLAVAALPVPPTGGFGLVRGLASFLVRRVGGIVVRQPLSGQRAVTADCLQACRPLAPGFGVDAAMLADAARLGFRVVEVPAEVSHRFTRRDFTGFVHRARQGAAVLRAMAPRVIGLR